MVSCFFVCVGRERDVDVFDCLQDSIQDWGMNA